MSVDKTAHVEHTDDGLTRHDLDTEDVRGRDFTVEASNLPPGYFRSLTFLGSMFAIGASFAAGVGGFSFAAPILAQINADIGPDANLTWVALSYLLTTSIGMIFVGRVTDIFGRRWFFITGNSIGLLGSIVCATAPNIPALIAGETLIGVGASVQLSYAFAVGEIVPTKWRFLAQAFVYSFQIGTLMVTLGLMLFLMGISWGGVLHPWKSGHVIGTIVSGAILLIGFFFYEAYMPLKEPLMPVRLWRNKGWSVIIILWSLGAAVYYALAILWPSMAAVLYAGTHGTSWIGVFSSISSCGILFGEFCGCPWKRWTHWQIRAVFTIGSIFLACMATCDPDTPVRAAIFVFLAALFIGWNEILCSTVSTICIDDQREIGTATGVGGSSRSFISTICSTVYTVILSNRLAQTIPAQVPPALVAAGLPTSSVADFLTAIAAGTPAAWSAVKGLTPQIQAIGVRAYQQANSDAYKTVFLSTIAFSGIGVILSIFCPNVDHLLSSDVAVTLRERGTERVVGEGKEGAVEEEKAV
ncbi:MFS general substrate transporter [Rhizodiscina lignyota]|uniref:MFS general substrate transporter n=1 Tax=Rhizodiscina lignyota TaxID=1504668 RepID=A0A9P4IMT8_9PEZI|nr:MFS general substrate transporter [Rhizodiscina lignyota]